MKPASVAVEFGERTRAQLLLKAAPNNPSAAGTLFGYVAVPEASQERVRFVVTGVQFDDSTTHTPNSTHATARFPLGIRPIGRFATTTEGEGGVNLVEQSHRTQLHALASIASIATNSSEQPSADPDCCGWLTLAVSSPHGSSDESPMTFAWWPQNSLVVGDDEVPTTLHLCDQVTSVNEQQAIQTDMVLAQVRLDVSVACWTPTNNKLDRGNNQAIVKRIAERLLERVRGERGVAETPFAQLPSGAVVSLTSSDDASLRKCVGDMDAASLLLPANRPSGSVSGGGGKDDKSANRVKLFVPAKQASGSGKSKGGKGKGGSKGGSKGRGGGGSKRSGQSTGPTPTTTPPSEDAASVRHFLLSGTDAESQGVSCADVRLLWRLPITDPVLQRTHATGADSTGATVAPVVSLSPIGHMVDTASSITPTHSRVQLRDLVWRLATLCLVPRSASAASTVALMQAAVARALADVQECASADAIDNDANDMSTGAATTAAQSSPLCVTTLHFWPSTLGLPVSLAVPHDESTLRSSSAGCSATTAAAAAVSPASSFESQFWIPVASDIDDTKIIGTSHRNMLQRLLLGMSLPSRSSTFRPSSAVRPVACFSSSASTATAAATAGVDMNTPLRNVHLGPYALGPTTVRDGRIALVRGDYGYYHYKMEGMDDCGWGCAYRSLQTIISWFGLNRFTNARVPSIGEIQQVLVDMKVMDAAFTVGCRQWIGSFEVEWVLDKVVSQVQCKRMALTCGSEMQDKARELVVHFETHGTPVMVGGGSLAFTLVGAAFSEDSGEVEYLILDPHYSGANVLRTVQSKKQTLEGYKAIPCGWRTVADAFVKGKPYNICLPQNPAVPTDS